MKLEEVTRLREYEEGGCLRMPKQFKDLNSANTLRTVNNAIEYLLSEKRCHFSLLVKKALTSCDGIVDIQGNGNKNNPYELTTDFGSGAFYNAREFFDKKEYPKFIVKNECFSNCYMLVTKGVVKDCEILSGIAYRGEGGRPFLHSVIKVDNKVMDFNYNICMDEELYYALFNFEVLNRLDSKTMMKDYEIIKKYYSYLNSQKLTTMHAVFAWEDLVDVVNSKININKKQVGI